MRDIDPGLAAHIAAGVTTLCRCFRVERSDGAVLGFTDHDRSLSFGGVTYDPVSGFDAGEDVATTGMAVGGLEVFGALTSERIDAEDLAAGLYDNAAVSIYLVNWSSPDERLLTRTGTIGEVVREDTAFRAEVRGPAAVLDQVQGRAFLPVCDAEVGDGRCSVNLDTAAFRGNGTVVAAADRRVFTATGLAGFDENWFDRGQLTWTTGANAGLGGEVRSQTHPDDTAIDLWQPTPYDIAPGDTFVVTAGCDKRFETCRKKFDNGINFRGFPHMPGNDFTLSYARRGDHNDGKPVVE